MPEAGPRCKPAVARAEWTAIPPPSSCRFGFATTSKCWRLDGLARNRTFVEGYLAAPFEKALARKLPDNHMFGGWGYKSIGEALEGALEGCGRQRPTERSPSRWKTTAGSATRNERSPS
jgi:hypothetical protein